jgi:exopolyphosphatase/pppGpp-phosphohydrolase
MGKEDSNQSSSRVIGQHCPHNAGVPKTLDILEDARSKGGNRRERRIRRAILRTQRRNMKEDTADSETDSSERRELYPAVELCDS